MTRSVVVGCLSLLLSGCADVAMISGGIAHSNDPVGGERGKIRAHTAVIDAQPQRGQSNDQRMADRAACEDRAAEGADQRVASHVTPGWNAVAINRLYQRWADCMTERGYTLRVQ